MKEKLIELLTQYYYVITEKYNNRITYLMYYLENKMVFEKDDEIIKKLKKELDLLNNESKKIINLLNYILKNINKIKIEDMYGVLNEIDNLYIEKYEYIDNILNRFDVALKSNDKDYFYISQEKIKLLTESDINNYITYLKGYNIDNIKDFIIINGIYEEHELDNILKNIKVLNIDCKDNIDFFGIYENSRIIVPKIKDEQSTLINIHELIHNKLLSKENEIEKEIVFGEDLPILYELLFQSENKFTNINIHKTDNAYKLYNDFNEEPFDIQIQKLKKLIKINNC